MIKLFTSLCLTLIVSFLPVVGFAQAAPNPFIFDTSTAAVGHGVPTNDVSLCASMEGSGPGSTLTMPVGSVLYFRFGPGFGHLNGFDLPRITHWSSAPPPANPVEITDFDITFNSANGKIIFTYNGTTAKQLAFRDLICVEANWDSPSNHHESGVIDFNHNLLGSPQSIGHIITVQ